MRNFIGSLIAVSLLLSGCTRPADIPADSSVAMQTASPVTRVNLGLPPLRYAILSETTPVNIWALFDESGASYENYAVRGGYSPRLYHLSGSAYDLTPLLADGLPSAFVEEDEFMTATIKLLPNLAWSDNSPLTAEDIAFTANTALAFKLGLNWKDYYNPDVLDHVEAVDAQTIKYYFKRTPAVADWQYGALLGVIVNRAYWEPKLANARALLPLPEDDLVMADYQTQIDIFQADIDSIAGYMTSLKEGEGEYRSQKRALEERQGERDSLLVKLHLANHEKRNKLAAARTALYALEDSNEPTAGAWRFDSSEDGKIIENAATAKSVFNHIRYTIYDKESALQALLADEVDFILTPAGLSQEDVENLSADPAITIIQNQRNDIRFLAFNHARSSLADIALREALACVIDVDFLAENVLEGQVYPSNGWVPAKNLNWHNPEAKLPCHGLDAGARLAKAVEILKTAGYVWEVEPTQGVEGIGLKMPNGETFPALQLLAPNTDYDPLRAAASIYVEEGARSLGIPLTSELLAYDDLFYAVYGVRNYDMAILGWSLNLYPDYLCAFFDQASGNASNYFNATLETKCDAFLNEPDIVYAREQAFELQFFLNEELPAMPLFSSIVTEAHRNLEFPYAAILDGFGPGLYGAPSLVTPIEK